MRLAANPPLSAPGRARAARRPCRWTPLHLAAFYGHCEAIVAELLLRGADGAVQNNDG